MSLFAWRNVKGPEQTEFFPEKFTSFSINNSKGAPRGSEDLRKSTRARILIVEDEKLVAVSLKEALEEEGYKVVGIASSGEEAIAIFTDKDPDLILMDVHLAGKMDGIQTAIVIHYTLKPVRILFLTAYSQDQFPHLGAINPPLFKYIRKPYQPKMVLDALKELLARD